MGKVTKLNPRHYSPRVDVGYIKPAEQLDAETTRAIRQLLERVAVNIERCQTGATSASYRCAYKNAARIVRNHKPD